MSKEKKWYAIYTRPRTEKKVNEQLLSYNYEAYLPLKKEFRQWKDRLKKVQVPLFSSYVFVKVNEKEYLEIPRLIKGFVRYVTIGGQKVAIREEEIETIKRMLDFSEKMIDTSNEKFELNQKVEIKAGKLKGFVGKLVELRGKYKLAIRIESLNTNLLIEVDKNNVKKVK